MPRSRYRFVGEDAPYFMTMTVNHWLPVFTRSDTVEILLDSWRWLQLHEGTSCTSFPGSARECGREALPRETGGRASRPGSQAEPGNQRASASASVRRADRGKRRAHPVADSHPPDRGCGRVRAANSRPGCPL